MRANEFVTTPSRPVRTGSRPTRGHETQPLYVQLDELSTDLLGRYKKAAYADAKKADAEGDYERGNKRFKGINKATNKQFDNDLKKHKEQGVAEADMNRRGFLKGLGAAAAAGAAGAAGAGDFAGSVLRGAGSGMASGAAGKIVYKDQNEADIAFADKIPDEWDKIRYTKAVKSIIRSRGNSVMRYMGSDSTATRGSIMVDEKRFNRLKTELSQKYNIPIDQVKEQYVAEGLSKRDQQDVAAIRAAIERLQAQLKQPNADRDAIQQSIAHERKRLALYGQGMTEASKDPKEIGTADTQMLNILLNPDRKQLADYTPEEVSQLQKLAKVLGRARKIIGGKFTGMSVGQMLDRFAAQLRTQQRDSGQMPDFTGRATTTADMAQQIAMHTNGKNYQSQGTTWTSGRTGQRNRDANDYVKYPDENSYDDAWEWAQSKGKKVNYRDNFNHLNTAVQIGSFIVEPSNTTSNAFGDSPTTLYQLSVRTVKSLDQPSRRREDITDQQAAALQDIAQTKNTNTMSQIKMIMALFQGEQNFQQIIDRSKKINPNDKAKLDQIVAGAKNFRDNGQQGVAEGWSQKYKSSINCSHPKGFSQKAHCAGKKKHNESMMTIEATCPDCGMCETHGSLNEIKKGAKDSNGFTKCWSGYHAAGTKKGKNGGQVRNCVPNESIAEAMLALEAELESLAEEGKASRKLCASSKPDSELGASQLASCKSQGLRSRDGNKSHKLGKSPKSRVKVGGHKIKGQKYGGPLPDWS